MKRSTIYLTLAGLAVVVAAAVEIPQRQYLNERLARYRTERAAIERLEREYRRPVLDEPIEQNAATWYARALPNLTKTPINALQSARVRRETYVGPWLPEPVDTSADPYLGAERGEALEFATLMLMDHVPSKLTRASSGVG